MRIFILIGALVIGSVTFATAQTADESKAERIDAQIENLKNSLDTIDIARLFEQFSIQLGDETIPSDKSLLELENGMDKMLGMMDKIDVVELEGILQSFIGEMDSMLSDFDINLDKEIDPSSKNDVKEPTNEREIKKM